MTAEAFAALWVGGSQPLIANLRARVELVAGVPVSFADRGDIPNCYICCPSVAYRDYGIEETRLLHTSRLVQGASVMGLRSTGPLLRATGLDHQCQINNWMLATNPPMDWPAEQVAALMQAMAAAHPDRAVVLRSLNDRTDGALIAGLRRAGATLIPARQVWLRPPDAAGSRDFRRDAALLAASALQQVPGEAFTPNDFEVAARLYGMLYLQKYTMLNPQYSAAFLCGMQRAGVMRLVGLRGEAGMVAVIGTVDIGGVLTAPVVGYRTDLQQEMGLYRMLMAIAISQAQGRMFHMSAGAAGFKRNRGAVPAIEYTAAYVRHLPRRARTATAVLAGLLDRLAVPVMRKYAL